MILPIHEDQMACRRIVWPILWHSFVGKICLSVKNVYIEILLKPLSLEKDKAQIKLTQINLINFQIHIQYICMSTSQSIDQNTHLSILMFNYPTHKNNPAHGIISSYYATSPNLFSYQFSRVSLTLSPSYFPSIL